VSAPTDASRRGGHKAVAALFLPRTWASRLAFLAIMILWVASFPIPSWLSLVLIIPGLVAFISAFFMMMNKIDRYLTSKEESGWSEIFKIAGYLALVACIWAVPLGVAFLVSLVGGGEVFSTTYHHSYENLVGSTELVLALATTWLLFGVPNQAFKISLDNDGKGDAQRVLVRLITAASCVLTIIYLLLMHSNGWPLYKLRRGPLVAGIVVTILLVAPLYRSMARACWQRGLGGVISYEALKQYWGNASTEARKALDQSAESKALRGSEGSSAATKPNDDTAVPNGTTPPASAESSTRTGTQPPAPSPP
jgi:hypothetical protein